MTDQQTETHEQRTKLEQSIQELEAKLESESAKLLDLQLKLHEMNAFSLPGFQNIGSMVPETVNNRFTFIFKK